MRDFECHASTAQRLAGVVTTLLIRIHNRQSSRYPVRLRQVVIGDDEIDAPAVRCFASRECPNTGVHADDDANAAVGRLLDHLIAHPVAFTDAMRHVVLRLSPAEFDGGLENHDCGSAVHVVVAIDQDGFAALDRCAQSLHRDAEAGH